MTTSAIGNIKPFLRKGKLDLQFSQTQKPFAAQECKMTLIWFNAITHNFQILTVNIDLISRMPSYFFYNIQ